MKKINFFNSFSTRISLLFQLVTGTIFTIAFVIFYHSARDLVKTEAEKHAATSLEKTVLQIDEVLYSVEIAVKNNAWLISQHIHEPDSMYTIIAHLLENNPIISGSAIAFRPDFYKEKGYYYSPYSYRSKTGSIVRKQLGNDDYDYPCMDWYLIPRLLKKSYWSEPYFDDGGGNMMMTTYSLPLYDSSGDFFAVFTADISLKWLTQKVNDLHIYPNSYNIVIGRSSTYLVHPYPERILNETFFTATQDMADSTAIEKIGKDMIAGKKGFSQIYNDDSLSTSYIFYEPIKRAEWSMGVICTYKDIFADIDKIREVVLFIAIIGLFLQLVFNLYIIRRQTRPLSTLADATLQIAKGDITAQLPAAHLRHNEIGILYQSFASMQQSLAQYINELQVTTKNKERIESELRIASAIQMDMIPKIFPPFPERNDIDIYATLVPAKEVGGDLYDFFVDNDILYFTIADVSGKGVPASLLMAVTRSLFRNIASHLSSPGAVVASLNNSIASSNESGMFVTLFLGILDLTTGELRYCNAGHNAPVLQSGSGEDKPLDVVSNLPLGVLEGFEYQEQSVQLTSPSTLFLYTDGVTEAENKNKELFSEERLISILTRQASQQDSSPQEIIRTVMDEVHRYADGTAQNDDITMLCIRYLLPVKKH